MKKLPKLPGATDKHIAALLKDYIVYRTAGIGIPLYICMYLDCKFISVHRGSIDRYIEEWRKLLYPKHKNNLNWGIFGKPLEEKNDERIVFCLQIITEIENK